jgi:hypothetical protein
MADPVMAVHHENGDGGFVYDIVQQLVFRFQGLDLFFERSDLSVTVRHKNSKGLYKIHVCSYNN